VRRAVAILAVTLSVASSAAAPALARAVESPLIPPGPPPGGAVAPLGPTEQSAACALGGVVPGSRFQRPPVADLVLNYSAAWRFSRGAGQRVAVIDTGVAPSVRLPGLQGGGDYVSSSDGLVDCDAHGTVVAGLIAATPAPGDGFAGVAPEATILSIRQNSGAYSVTGSRSATDDPNAVSVGYGSTLTLALAVVRAVEMGATVINLSETACAPVGAGMDDAALGQAVRFAFERDVVVVAAAGNVDERGLCSVQNQERDPNRPLSDAWNSVSTIASPAWFEDYVLTVGAVTPDAQPADFSLHGPWVDVAAPAENLTSLSPNGSTLINAYVDPQGGLVPINGTSFAAPLVSGVVALIRSRFPALSAAEVMERVKRTAHTPDVGPNAATGYGIVDPVAALTYVVPPAEAIPPPYVSRAIAEPRPQDGNGNRTRNVVLAVVGVCAVLAAVALATIRRPEGR
jgi:membrane-anchored mycosin MYCP